MNKQPENLFNGRQVQNNQHKASTIYQQKPNQYQNSNKEADNQIRVKKQIQIAEQSIKNWFISLGLFAAAFGIYVGVWIVQKFAMDHKIASHYYESSYKWSSAIPSTPNYQIKVASETKTVALSLLLDWVMWKGPLMFFTYECMRLNQGKLKWILAAISALICIGADIALTIFKPSVYHPAMFFGLFSVITVVTAIVGNLSLSRMKQAILDSFLPLLCIGLVFGIQILGLPILYDIYSKYLAAQTFLFLKFYAYPIIDLIMYSLILVMGYYVSQQVRTFHSRIHFLLVGYEVGFILLIGYTEVEFYYLCSYLIFRNVFANWVMWNWDNVVKLPPLVAGWVFPYYFSYILMFLPFSGIGNIILGHGYYSIILVNTNTVLYNIPSSLYPYDQFTPSSNPQDYSLNLSLKGNIFKIAAGIIWVATTFSQRYTKKMPQILNSLVYNLWGIYLFYLGLSAGISTPSLTMQSLNT